MFSIEPQKKKGQIEQDKKELEKEEQRNHLAGRITSLQQEDLALKGNLQQALNEGRVLQGRLQAGHEAWQSSQGELSCAKQELNEERQRNAYIFEELRRERQKVAHIESHLGEELRGERLKTAQMEATIQALRQQGDLQNAEVQAMRNRLSILEAQGTSLPERVSKILADKEEEIREGKLSVAKMFQRQAEEQSYVSELRAENAEFKTKAKEWQERYKDLENVHYHSGHKSAGTVARPSQASRAHIVPPLLTGPADPVRSEPPPQ